jgi:hypothetical protein
MGHSPGFQITVFSCGYELYWTIWTVHSFFYSQDTVGGFMSVADNNLVRKLGEDDQIASNGLYTLCC